MKPLNSSVRRRVSLTGFFLGFALTLLTCGLLIRHARTFSLKRDTAVMIGTALPELKSTVALLEANREAETFFAENALASREEQASVYVLPDGVSTVRAVTSLQEIARAIVADGGNLTVIGITFDAPPTQSGDITLLRSRVVLRGDFRSIARFLAVISFSGTMLVRDVLTDEDSDAFLRLVEASAPQSLRSAVDFLYADVLAYAADTDKSEQVMLRDVPVEAQADIRSLLLWSGLASVRVAFDGIAQQLHDASVWPLPLMSLQSLQRSGDMWTAELVFYRR